MKKAAPKKNQSTLLQTWGFSGNNHIRPASRSSGPGGGGGGDRNRNDHGKVKKSKSPIEINVIKKEEEPSSTSVLADPNLDLDGVFDDDLDLDDRLDLLHGGGSCNGGAEKDVFLDDHFDPDAGHEDIEGFDMQFGSTYIYPTNYPVRDYQFSIMRRALVENTLVVLPTGLGKTFIAAVLIYNFYRWYPRGKLIFMAPTKPLVAQQIEACYNIMGIPQSDTAEMTGTINPQKRELMWKSKRVFFLTPQVLQNDIGRGSCFAPDVICLVFDEAHRALGNHAYCQVVREVARYHTNFRVLALSATPGDDMKAVQQVIENLMISHIEMRTEECADMKKYSFEREVQKVVVPLSEKMKKIQVIHMQVMQTVVDRLFSKNAIWQNSAQCISKYALLQAREQWRNSNTSNDKLTIGVIEGDFALAMSLFHSHEVLHQHGILSFYNFLKGVLAGTKGTPRTRMELSRNPKFMEMMEDLHKEIEPNEMNQSLNESIMDEKRVDPKKRLMKSIPQPRGNFASHPKLEKLQEIVLDHFRKFEQKNNKGESSNTNDGSLEDSRIIIFSQYRDSVQEITSVLSPHEPLVRVMSFIGQGSKDSSTSGRSNKGLSQKEQLEVIQKFRSGGYNTIVSTSVGEEGLDIGQVDLIICFDAPSSPIRLIQRMGRTGRKRVGKIVMLVTEGKEDAAYKRSLSSKKGIHKKLLNAVGRFEFYKESRRMIPRHMNPKCYKMSIAVDKYQKKGRGSKKADAKDDAKATTSKRKPLQSADNGVQKHIQFKKDATFLEESDQEYLQRKFFGDLQGCPKCKYNQSVNKDGKFCSHVNFKYPLSLTSWCPWQTSSQYVASVGHSTRTRKFCKVMRFMEKAKEHLSDEYEKTMKVNLKADDILSVDNDTTADKTNKKQKKNDNGKTWRQNYVDNCNTSSGSEDDIFDAISGIKKSAEKRKNTLRIEDDDDEDLKPCSLEKLLQKVDSDQKHKKKERVRLTKLPKLPNREVDIATIEDNQLNFCSQVSMDTLYNRIRKKSDPSLRTLHDEINEKINEEIIEDIEDIEEDRNPVLDWLKNMQEESTDRSSDLVHENNTCVSPKGNMVKSTNIVIEDDVNDVDCGSNKNTMLPPTSYPKKRKNVRIAGSNEGKMLPPKLPYKIPQVDVNNENERKGWFTNDEKKHSEEKSDKDDGIYGLLPMSTPRECAKPRKVCVVSPIIRNSVPEPPPDTDLDWCTFDDDTRNNHNGNPDGSISSKCRLENSDSPPLFSDSPPGALHLPSENDVLDINSASKEDKTIHPCKEGNSEKHPLLVREPPADDVDLSSDDDNDDIFISSQPVSKQDVVVEDDLKKEKGKFTQQKTPLGMLEHLMNVDNDDNNDFVFKSRMDNDYKHAKVNCRNVNVNDNFPKCANDTEIDKSSNEDISSKKSIQELSFTKICEKATWKNMDLNMLDDCLNDSLNGSLVDISSSPPMLSQYSTRCDIKSYEKVSRQLPAEIDSVSSKRQKLDVNSVKIMSSSKKCIDKSWLEQLPEKDDDEFIQSSQVRKNDIVKKITNKTSNKLQKFLYKSTECNEDTRERLGTCLFKNNETAKNEDNVTRTVTDVADEVNLPIDEGCSLIVKCNEKAPNNDSCSTPPIERNNIDAAVISSDDDSPVIKRNNARAANNKKCIIYSQITPPAVNNRSDCNDQNAAGMFDVTEEVPSPDDDFATKKLITRRKRSSDIKRRNRLKKNDYIDYEAEDDCDDKSEGGDETQVNGYVMDSFVDDSTQLSPSIRRSTNQNITGNSSVNMNLVYKQSLMSPSNCPLKFKTPSFKAGRNCFRLVNLEEKYNNLDPDEDSEAEEVMGLVESDEDFVCSEPDDSKYKHSPHDKSVYANKVGKKKLFRTSVIETDETFEDNEDEIHDGSVTDDSYLEVKKKPLKRVCKILDSDDEDDFKEPGNSSKNTEQQSGKKSWCKTFSVWELPEITFSFGIDWIDNDDESSESPQLKKAEKSNVSDKKNEATSSVEANDIGQENMMSTPLVIIDSKCISNNKIASSLRLKENCKVIAHEKLGVDYIISKRTALLRKTLSDVTSGGSHIRLHQNLRSLCELFSKTIIIIEKDRVKANGNSKRPSCFSKYYAGVLTKLVCANITILNSDNEDETASLIGKLARSETEKGYAITDIPKDDKQQMLKSLLHIPKMNYPNAVELVTKCTCFKQLVKCSLEEMKKILHFVPPQQVSEYYFFFQRRFDLTQIGCDKIK